MKDSYYRELVDKVRRNEEMMWTEADDSGEAASDFGKLWGILGDADKVSAETFVEAAELCLTSFYGSEQDHKEVWGSLADRYLKGVDNPDDGQEFRESFIAFADTYEECEDPDCVEQFSKMMHTAIRAGDSGMAAAVAACAFCPAIWAEDRLHPEWSVWFAVFYDKDFSEIPRSAEAASAIEELFLCLGDDPGMERLRRLNAEYFG